MDIFSSNNLFSRSISILRSAVGEEVRRSDKTAHGA
jgi:hypothetical protein